MKYQDLGRLHTPEYFNFATDVVDRWAEDPDKQVKPGSMGLPAPGMEVDENLQPLPPNREGDIAIRIKLERPLGLFVEYERNERVTRRWSGNCRTM